MSTIVHELRGAVAILTLNSPHDYNALNVERMVEINAALDRAIEDPKVRSIVLTGTGRGFCSGARFGEIFALGQGIGQVIRQQVAPIITKLHNGPKPTVVAINGPAAGAGVGVALAGDIAIAARRANFRLSFVKLGAVLDGGTSWLLQRMMGAARTKALALTGEVFSAELAQEWGLVWKCVDDEQLMVEALAIANRLAEGPPLAMKRIREQLVMASRLTLEEALEQEAKMQSHAFMTEDLKEGASAFIEKRRPLFTGS